MSRFPSCRQQKRRAHGLRGAGLRWLAAEPYRLFFLSGAVWSVIGVALWPLYYGRQLGFHPGLAHARIMIEVFGGGFVAGFLGTAGPRMAAAPRLTRAELLWLLALHLACGLCHLTQRASWGDAAFVVLLGSLLLCLVIRVARHGRETPPPQMLLALTGLGCGMAGAVMLLFPATYLDAQYLRLAALLLYQGLLLPPVLGIGSFVFPRMLGGDFGDAKTAAQGRVKSRRAIAAALLLVGSFFLEVFGNAAAGLLLRAGTAAAYLLVEVHWRPRRTGALTTGLFWALALGGLGMVLVPLHDAPHASIEHLLYIGGFGMLMLIVGSRVLFGHSGDLEGFFARSKQARYLVVLGVLAAATRATPAWAPSTTVSHHIYAALTWMALVVLWLFWHRRRFFQRDGGASSARTAG